MFAVYKGYLTALNGILWLKGLKIINPNGLNFYYRLVGKK